MNRLELCNRGRDEPPQRRYAIETGALDGLINNAGISHRSLLQDTDPSVIRRVMQANFFDAAAQGCTLLLSDSTARKAWRLNRLAPGFYARIMRRRVGGSFPGLL